MKIKTYAILSSILMGTLGAAISMVPQERTASAAVLVYDAKNVEEAIKTAITTADILTNEEKQLALQIINMRSMDAEQILSYLQSHSDQQQQVWDERMGKAGALDPNMSTESFLETCFPNIENILNGNMTMTDAYAQAQKSLQALEKTNADALHNAKTTQTAGLSLHNSLHQVLENSKNAEGEKEAQQANTQAAAVGATAQIYGNNLLSDMAAIQAVKYQKEIQEEAMARSINDTTYEKLHAATQGSTPQPVSFDTAMKKMGED